MDLSYQTLSQRDKKAFFPFETTKGNGGIYQHFKGLCLKEYYQKQVSGLPAFLRDLHECALFDKHLPKETSHTQKRHKKASKKGSDVIKEH